VAIAGYLPSSMVQCIATFMNACYIARRDVINGPALEQFRKCVDEFHRLRNIFIQVGVRVSISLPRQHALSHYYYAIQLFGSPNGLCSSITESKHIKAVKEPWRRSSRFDALTQMLSTLVRLDKMTTLRHQFRRKGMLAGSTSSYTMMGNIETGSEANSQSNSLGHSLDVEDSGLGCDTHEMDDDNEKDINDSLADGDGDCGPVDGNPLGAMSEVKLARKCRML
jgi:hypothetical protein